MGAKTHFLRLERSDGFVAHCGITLDVRSRLVEHFDDVTCGNCIGLNEYWREVRDEELEYRFGARRERYALDFIEQSGLETTYDAWLAARDFDDGNLLYARHVE